MAHDFEDSTDNDTGDDLNDLESFLREKDKQWTKPATELTPTDLMSVPNLDEHFELHVVDDAAEKPSDEKKSTETIESTPVEASPSAPDVESESEAEPVPSGQMTERGTELTLHTHPITGTYVSEDSVAWQMDPKVLELFNRTRQIGVTKLDAAQIIERFHNMDRAVKLIRIQQQGLQSALAEKVSKMNEADKAKYMEMHREAALRNATKRRVERSKKHGAGSAAVSKAKKPKKSPIAHRIDTLKNNLGFTKEAVVSHLRDAKLLDEAALAYIEKLVW